MKNKIGDLRNHMFAQLERLGQEGISKEDLLTEIQRAQAISEVGKVIVDSAKTEVLYAKLTRKREDAPDKFLEVDEPEKPKLERPPAEYSNKKHGE